MSLFAQVRSNTVVYIYIYACKNTNICIYRYMGKKWNGKNHMFLAASWSILKASGCMDLFEPMENAEEWMQGCAKAGLPEWVSQVYVRFAGQDSKSQSKLSCCMLNSCWHSQVLRRKGSQVSLDWLNNKAVIRLEQIPVINSTQAGRLFQSTVPQFESGTDWTQWHMWQKKNSSTLASIHLYIPVHIDAYT